MHDFRRVLECVPGKHISPGLYMKAVAIASMWTRGEAADGTLTLPYPYPYPYP